MEKGLLEKAVEAGRAEVYSLAAVAMFQVIDMVTMHEHPKLMRVCLAIAIGAESRSQTAVAEEFGVDKATVSKWARRFVKVLALVPGRGMRRPAAVEAYRARATRVWQVRFEEQQQEAA